MGVFFKTRPITLVGLKRKLTMERQYGDRWATAYSIEGETKFGEILLLNVFDDEWRAVDPEVLEDLDIV